MRRLIYTSSAEDDFAAIALHLIEQTLDEVATEAFVRKLRERCRRLASLPGILGSARPELRPDIRSTPAGNYVIFFRYQDDDTMEIVQVLEGHRDIQRHFEP